MRRLLLLLLIAFPLAAQEIGKPLPAWSRGMLDIHQISTGRGNSAFLMFPDGTTMLVDAGAANDGVKMADTDPRPDASRTAGGWIVRYVQRAMAPAAPHLDYAVLTHFHADHMGAPTAASLPSKSGTFKLTGIAEVGEAIPIDTLIDRGYAYLPPAEDAMLKNFHAFLSAYKERMREETIKVGRADQIVLRHDAKAFPNFEVRNVAADGMVWSGNGDDARSNFPPLDSIAAEDKPSENMCSIGLRIRYGTFDYFTGGDMPGVPDAGAPEWQSVETAVAKVIGPTDVHVANHHGSIDPESAFFLSTLRSSVINRAGVVGHASVSGFAEANDGRAVVSRPARHFHHHAARTDQSQHRLARRPAQGAARTHRRPRRTGRRRVPRLRHR